jgi:fermentation-respiration switch protein FrsA (DUF1100 family)
MFIYVANVLTPLLLIHGEKDLHCPIEHAEPFFVALKAQKNSEISLFPRCQPNERIIARRDVKARPIGFVFS